MDPRRTCAVSFLSHGRSYRAPIGRGGYFCSTLATRSCLQALIQAYRNHIPKSCGTVEQISLQEERAFSRNAPKRVFQIANPLEGTIQKNGDGCV